MSTYKIAFYGKGGIGKSTIASNVSALLAMQGKKVLHIGCDPKADSTRLLCKKQIKTVLELLEEKESLTREDLIYQSEYGVYCVESGGPQAGSGCAGLGIITAMGELNRFKILEEDWDVIVYDVLGDVVCGGFSTPMRKHYVDKVYVVSSTDFMALYAANNILKGIKTYSDDKNLFGGFVFNHIHSKEEEYIAKKFCDKVNGRIASMIYESKEMKKSDFKKEIYVKNGTDSKNNKSFNQLVEDIYKNEDFLPEPLNKVELEQFGMELGRELENYEGI